jgi:hypothetical protein
MAALQSVAHRIGNGSHPKSLPAQVGCCWLAPLAPHLAQRAERGASPFSTRRAVSRCQAGRDRHHSFRTWCKCGTRSFIHLVNDGPESRWEPIALRAAEGRLGICSCHPREPADAIRAQGRWRAQCSDDPSPRMTAPQLLEGWCWRVVPHPLEDADIRAGGTAARSGGKLSAISYICDDWDAWPCLVRHLRQAKRGETPC